MCHSRSIFLVQEAIFISSLEPCKFCFAQSLWRVFWMIVKILKISSREKHLNKTRQKSESRAKLRFLIICFVPRSQVLGPRCSEYALYANTSFTHIVTTIIVFLLRYCFLWRTPSTQRFSAILLAILSRYSIPIKSLQSWVCRTPVTHWKSSSLSHRNMFCRICKRNLGLISTSTWWKMVSACWSVYFM